MAEISPAIRRASKLHRMPNWSVTGGHDADDDDNVLFECGTVLDPATRLRRKVEERKKNSGLTFDPTRVDTFWLSQPINLSRLETDDDAWSAK